MTEEQSDALLQFARAQAEKIVPVTIAFMQIYTQLGEEMLKELKRSGM